MFPQRYNGSVFHITIHKGENKTKEGIKCHLVTSKDQFIILSND